jgi:hypothetical protein
VITEKTTTDMIDYVELIVNQLIQTKNVETKKQNELKNVMIETKTEQ